MQAVTNTHHYTGVDQRICPRSDVYARLPVTLPDGRSLIATVVNISADGLLIRHDGKVDENGNMTIALPVIGRTTARAVWALGGRVGAQFDRPIAQQDYDSVLRALGGRSTS